MGVPGTTVAVIGTGRMGGSMAATIDRAGFDVVLWNRDPAKAERVAETLGATVAGSAADAASKAGVILSSLADDAAVEEVYLGPEGIVQGIGAGSVAVDASTIDPRTVERVGAAVDATGAGFVDCPVSGSVSTVEAGTLTIMAGGDPALIERVRPVLDAMAQRVIHVGGRGAGAATKLAVNGLVHGLNVALAEALVLAERAGVERSTAYEVFASGAGGAPFVQYKRAAYEDPEGTPVAFSLDLVAKDLELITGLGERVGAPMRQAATSLDIVRSAIADGFGERDLSAIAVFLRGGEA
ncbi:MAG TPA: NAD(P)-dependent oxidoreductase [Actinomycetota bacterium]|nr:NAD(P)-dependent oxidoreductase [Actinomycetota bacterium]